MAKQRILLRDDERAELEYICARLAEHSWLSFGIRRFKGYRAVEITSENPCLPKVAANIVASVVTSFYKFRDIETSTSGYENVGLEKYAFLGALLSVDVEDESIEVENAALKLYEIAPQSLTEHRLGGITAGWASLARLGMTLLGQCSEPNEVYELVSFLLTTEKAVSKVVTVGDEPGKPSVTVGTVELIIPKLTGDYESDLLIAVVREKPLKIIMKDPDAISDKLLHAFRSLGEG